jgi:serine/threonine protein kinase
MYRKTFSDNTNKHEREIVKLLYTYPHPNIVKILYVGKDFYDMERLDVKHPKNPDVIPQMNKALEHLHSLNICYIDWKSDNIGFGVDGQFKLFDFDVSGLYDSRMEWVYDLPCSWTSKSLNDRGIFDPLEMDEYAFKTWAHALIDNDSLN